MHERSLARQLAEGAGTAAAGSPIQRVHIETGSDHIDPAALTFNLEVALSELGFQVPHIAITTRADLEPDVARLVTVTIAGP